MRGPVGEIQEEGAVAVRLDHPDRLLGVPVGQVAAGFEYGAAVVLRREAQRSPEELIDRIEVLLRVHDVRMILGQIEAARHEDALVESLIVGSHPVRASEMPFADVYVVVAPFSEQLRERDFRGGHAHLFVGNFDGVLVEQARSQSGLGLRALAEGYQASEAGGRRREFEAEARPVASRHQRGARRRTGRVRRIAVDERRAVGRDRIDVGRGHGAIRDAPAAEREIVPAEIVREDQDDVGRAFRGRPALGVGAARPRDLTGRPRPISKIRGDGSQLERQLQAKCVQDPNQDDESSGGQEPGSGESIHRVTPQIAKLVLGQVERPLEASESFSEPEESRRRFRKQHDEGLRKSMTLQTSTLRKSEVFIVFVRSDHLDEAHSVEFHDGDLAPRVEAEEVMLVDRDLDRTALGCRRDDAERCRDVPERLAVAVHRGEVIRSTRGVGKGGAVHRCAPATRLDEGPRRLHSGESCFRRRLAAHPDFTGLRILDLHEEVSGATPYRTRGRTEFLYGCLKCGVEFCAHRRPRIPASRAQRRREVRDGRNQRHEKNHPCLRPRTGREQEQLQSKSA